MKRESEKKALEMPPGKHKPLIINYVKIQNTKIKQEKLRTKKTSTKKKQSKTKNTQKSRKKKPLDQKKTSTDKKTPETHRKAKARKPHEPESSRIDYPVGRRKASLIFMIVLIPLITVSGYLMAGILQKESVTNYYGLEVKCDGNEAENVIDQDSMSRTFYIKNHNSEPVTLSFFTTNWEPIEAFNIIDVSWDYDGSPIPPSTTCKVVITIVNRSPNEMNNFVFNIDFIAHGV